MEAAPVGGAATGNERIAMSEQAPQKTSLTERQRKLEMMISCPAGKGQVYIRNLIDPALRAQGPHLALRCKIREFLGIKNPILKVEEIVITCCRNPMETCEAYRKHIKATSNR